MIPLEYALVFSFILFVIGAIGVLVRRNLLFILLSLEIMFNAVAVLFVAGSSQFGNADGHIMYILILTLAAAEMAVGLALVIRMYRQFHSLDVDELANMRG